MSGDWLGAAHRWHAGGTAFVIVTVMDVKGSAPCEVGRRMLVSGDGQHGTVGGGRLEQEALAQARSVLAGDEEASGLTSLTLGARLGQCCGGRVVVHHELVGARRPAVAVFGAGHVGQELARILQRLPCSATFVDSRAQWLDRLPAWDGLARVCEEEPVDAVADLPAGSACVVMTHRHDLDLEVCVALLRRGDMGMVGVIGSHSKAARFRGELKRRGLDPAALVCPVGTRCGKHPAAVAASMATRLCQELFADGEGAVADRQAQGLLEELARDFQDN